MTASILVAIITITTALVLEHAPRLVGSISSSSSSSSSVIKDNERKSSDWDFSDDEMEHLLSTIFTVFLVFIVSYWIVIRPWLSHKLPPPQQRHSRQSETSAEVTVNGMNNFSRARLVDGIQGYSSILASVRSTGSHALPTNADLGVAKQLMKTLASISQNPSITIKRGSIVVVTVKDEDVVQEHLKHQEQQQQHNKCTAHFLRCIACMTNLFVVIDFELSHRNQTMESQLRHLANLREYLYEMGLPSQLVPPHRIVAASSSVGRIAFVRQIRPELFFDYDVGVQDQLQRFGFQVILYGANQNITEGTNYQSLCDFLPTEAFFTQNSSKINHQVPQDTR